MIVCIGNVLPCQSQSCHKWLSFLSYSCNDANFHNLSANLYDLLSGISLPAAGNAKCEPMINVSVPPNRSRSILRDAKACSGNESKLIHSGCAIWQGWWKVSPV